MLSGAGIPTSLHPYGMMCEWRPAGEHLWSEHEEEAGRAELLKGAKAGAGRANAPGGRPGVRTAEDIKAAYGRPTNSKR